MAYSFDTSLENIPQGLRIFKHFHSIQAPGRLPISLMNIAQGYLDLRA